MPGADHVAGSYDNSFLIADSAEAWGQFTSNLPLLVMSGPMLTECLVVTGWVALDPTDVSNGCMQLWPGSHHQGIVPHHLPVPASPAAHIHYSVKDPPPAGEAVAVPMQPGDALIFNVSCGEFAQAICRCL